MKQPKRIRLCTPAEWKLLQLALIDNSAAGPYIAAVSDVSCWSAFVEDRDIKRLHKWCEYILQSRDKLARKKRPSNKGDK